MRRVLKPKAIRGVMAQAVLVVGMSAAVFIAEKVLDRAIRRKPEPERPSR